MVNDLPTVLTVPGLREANPFRTVAAVQGVYFLLTGLWPLVGIESFQAVTGRKVDLPLVYTAGCLIAVIGLALLAAARTQKITTEVLILAIGSALALAAIDVIFVTRGVISWVYLFDAVAEVAIVGWWMLAYVRTPDHQEPAARYPHLQALLARGRSVSPSANGSTES